MSRDDQYQFDPRALSILRQSRLTLTFQYGFCVFRRTGMDDIAHVEFSRRMGELDDIRPYMTAGRKMRYEYYELFDAGNVDEDGKVIDPNSPKAQYQKVSAGSLRRKSHGAKLTIR